MPHSLGHKGKDPSAQSCANKCKHFYPGHHLKLPVNKSLKVKVTDDVIKTANSGMDTFLLSVLDNADVQEEFIIL